MNPDDIRNALTKQKPEAPTERRPERDELIIRQNALAHADNMFQHLIKGGTLDEDKKAYFSLAGEIEAWILRGVR